MTPDPPVDEIREVRHRISEECGHDPKRLVERYIELQRRYTRRLLSVPCEMDVATSADERDSPAKPR